MAVSLIAVLKGNAPGAISSRASGPYLPPGLLARLLRDSNAASMNLKYLSMPGASFAGSFVFLTARKRSRSNSMRRLIAGVRPRFLKEILTSIGFWSTAGLLRSEERRLGTEG